VVLKIVQKTLDIISDAVAEGETIELRNFGVFEVKIRKARIGRNPNAPEDDVPIPPRAVVKFKPGKEMRERVLRLTPKA
jgi:nucleoid DNA-binding protein